jgi:hypothetical protein
MKAYPYMHKHPTSGQTTQSEGMDLRDYFAAKVMQALVTHKTYEFSEEHYKRSSIGAYAIADAMIQQRVRKEVPNE